MPTTVLVAHASEEERVKLSAALHDAGYDVIKAANGEEALRSTAGMNPTVVVAHDALEKVRATQVYARLRATGLSLPPFVILYDRPDELPEDTPDGAIYFIPSGGLTPAALVDHVRLILLADDISGEFEDGLDVMHGDLTRTSFGDLVQALQRHVLTGRVSFSLSTQAGVSTREGVIVDAWWGEARGRKAFNRLAGLPSGAFSLNLGEVAGERTLDADLATLLTDAVDERVEFEEALAELPSLESRAEVRLVKNFFELEFTEVERLTISRAQKASSLGELIDRVPATDLEVVQAVASLRSKAILVLSEPVSRVHLVTDSTADILPADARRLGITVLAVSLVLDAEVYKDGIDLTPEDFHRRLQGLRSLPVTNPVTRGEFMEVYRRFVTSGDILSIHCSSKLSKSYDNAVAAASEGMEEFLELRRQANVSVQPTILTVDAGQASNPMGMLVIFAARMLRKGLGVREVAARITSMAARLRTVLLVASLDSLQRTGEVRPEQVAGRQRRQDARPILVVKNGALELADSVAGGTKAFSRILELLEEPIDPARPVMASLVHASSPAGAAVLRRLLLSRFKVIELMENQIGPAVTCHVGPGAVGAAVFQPSDEETELLKVDGS